MQTTLINDKIYTLAVTIDGSSYNLTGRYDAAINAIRNLKKPSLFCSLQGDEPVVEEFDNVTDYRNSQKATA